MKKKLKIRLQYTYMYEHSKETTIWDGLLITADIVLAGDWTETSVYIKREELLELLNA